MNRSLRNVALLSAAGLSLVGSASAFGKATGSGATFPAIAYQTWCSDSGLCSYTGVGSGSGIKALAAKTVDFGASDVIMTDAQVATYGGANVTYVPTLLGAIAIPLNVSGVTGNKVKFDGSTLGDIFSGAITAWNDPKITKLNKGVAFPAAPITVCVRSDASGTSGNFSNFLSKVSASYKAKVSAGGQNQTPAWSGPVVLKGNGNAGVANCINTNNNSIGYVDLGDAMRAGLTTNIAELKRLPLSTLKPACFCIGWLYGLITSVSIICARLTFSLIVLPLIVNAFGWSRPALSSSFITAGNPPARKYSSPR